MSNALSEQQLYAEFSELLRTMPSQLTLHHATNENQDWLGHAVALVQLTDPSRAIWFRSDVEKLRLPIVNPPDQVQRILTTIHGFHHELRLRSGGAMAAVFDAGKPFDYFDQLRRVIEPATTDLLFIDAYINADFVASYLPHVRDTVRVRLLVSKYTSEVRSATQAYQSQRNLKIEVRQGKTHDRIVLIDKQQCWQSGSSFKDGAKNSSTVFIQMIDSFNAISAISEKQWDTAVAA